ncbi:carotenoid oxygenase family protein [Nocardia altamirensis]|uniref:carotenoid oxygenase family protein n=1 Tax=Nocardia altamirensis TaxID=472158 RepID=UPI0008407304|nr:carotenoid oxygenase family protein [Nocardia altamirensis]
MSIDAVGTPATGLYEGVYAPLLEEHDYRVEQIDGTLPKDLTGTLYRIGPGKHQVGRTLLHNLFDGDGMVSQFVLDGSSVRYRNRYVRTRHFTHGQRSDRIRYRGVGTQIPGGPPANIGRLPANVANTNIVNYDGGLLALWEFGNPHRIDPDTLDTLGAFDFDGRLGFLGAFSAHPKWDPDTGEMYNFGLDLLPTPRIRTYKVDRSGRLRPLATVPMLDLVWNHDFALTRKYLVFVLDPLLPDLSKIVPATHTFIDSLRFKKSKGTRFLLVPKAGGRPRIVEHQALLHFHLTNAYDDGDDVVVELVRFDTAWHEIRRLTNAINTAVPEGVRFPDSRLMQYRITRGGTVIERELTDRSVEFPQYDWRQSTRKHRYSYLAGKSADARVYDSIIKVDQQTGAETRCEFPISSVGEPLFVPRTPEADEDDGWLLFLNHELAEHRSQLVILDARDVERGPLATAWLNHHIPWGFHGTFTRRIAQSGTPIPSPDELPAR